uniref:Uncharacterized protein n=1 Tax=Sciurus vulgaris TaxID=55149 RepID=A0A8D2CM68_SCIVU
SKRLRGLHDGSFKAFKNIWQPVFHFRGFQTEDNREAKSATQTRNVLGKLRL